MIPITPSESKMSYNILYNLTQKCSDCHIWFNPKNTHECEGYLSEELVNALDSPGINITPGKGKGNVNELLKKASKDQEILSLKDENRRLKEVIKILMEVNSGDNKIPKPRNRRSRK